MLAVIWRAIRDRKISLIAYSIGVAIFTEMYVAIFPSFADQQDVFDELLEAYPDEMFEVLGLEKATFSLSELEPWLATEQFSLVWPIMAVIFAVSFGGAQIASEIEKGTIEVPLAQPIARTRLFLGRYLAGLAHILVFVLISVFAAIPLAAIHGIDYQLPNYFSMAALALLFATAVFSLSMLASSIFSEKGKSNFAVGGLIILMYVINIISAFLESLENLKYFSFFHYYDFSAALIDNSLDATGLLVFAGVSLVAVALGLVLFNRRDIAV